MQKLESEPEPEQKQAQEQDELREETAEEEGHAEVAGKGHAEAAEEVGHAEAAEEVGQAEAAEEVGQAEAAEEIGQAEAAEEVGQAEAAEEVRHAEAAEEVGHAEAAEEIGQAEAAEEVGYEEEVEAEMSENEIFIVERILQNDIVDGEELFLVHWKGYASDEDTWEPAENFTDLSLIDKFRERKDVERKEQEYAAQEAAEAAWIGQETAAHVQATAKQHIEDENRAKVAEMSQAEAVEHKRIEVGWGCCHACLACHFQTHK